MATTRRHTSTRGRKPVKRTRTAANSNLRARSRRKNRAPLKALIAVVLIVLAGIGIYQFASFETTDSKYQACEQWRGTVATAARQVELGDEWTDAILAAMYVESGGDTDVKSVEGVKGDILQAAEGKYGDIVKNGSAKYGVEAQTPEASIYAGCLEFKQNLKLWRDYLGGIGPDDSEKIQLVIQGYNFGADGWYRWCKKQGITSYSVETAQTYSDTQMPANAKGTPTHAQKWLRAYEKIRSDSADQK